MIGGKLQQGLREHGSRRCGILVATPVPNALLALTVLRKHIRDADPERRRTANTQQLCLLYGADADVSHLNIEAKLAEDAGNSLYRPVEPWLRIVAG